MYDDHRETDTGIRRSRRRSIRRALVAAATIGLPTAAAVATEAVDPAVQIVVAVDEGVEGSLDLLARLVDTNSGTLNFDGVRAVGAMLRPELDALGFATEWIDGETWGRAGHLVATRPGPGPRVLLIGHLDTVFEPDSPFQRFEREGDRARGPGIIDMKGGCVVMLLALQALDTVGDLDRLDLAVVLIGDEEHPGEPLELARRPLVELATGRDVAIGFEDGDGDPTTAVVSRRGSRRWELETTGVPAHSSQIHREEVGSGALFELARILDAFHDLRAPHLSLNTGLAVGGTEIEADLDAGRASAFGKPNVVPERAAALGDLRAFSLEQEAEIVARMEAIVADHHPRTSATLRFHEGYPPMGPTDGNRWLLDQLDQVSLHLALGPVEPAAIGRLGAADVSFAAPLVGAAIDGLGPGGTGGHTVEETADLSLLAVQAKRTAILLHRLPALAHELPARE